MSRLTLILCCCCCALQAAAQKLYVYPAAAVAPRGSYQTVTAVVNGVGNKTVTWSTTGGTLVGTNPCVVNEPCTIALYTTTPGTYTLTASSNASGAVTASSTITITASPTPATTHPRLYVTAAMLPGLQAKATNHNLIYQANLNYVTTYVYNVLSASPYSWKWTAWNGSACGTGTGLPAGGGYGLEGDANQMAYLSMVAPTAVLRNAWGCRARDVWVYEMTNILNGKENIQGNIWSDGSTALALTTDWLMGGGYLNSNDLALARSFLSWLAQQTLTKFVANGYIPSMTAAYNSSSLFNIPLLAGENPVGSMRDMGNNYTMSRMLILTAAALTFNDNPTDDPPLTNTCSATRYQICPDGTAGSLHAYWNYADGAMLYLMYAHLEDPNVSWQAYQAAYGKLPKQPTCLYTSGAPIPCFGDGRGGESSEGSWYGYSLVRLRYLLNILYTAGYNDPMLYGPQVSLGTSSWWDLKYVSDLEFLTGFAQNNGGPGGKQPAYSYLTTGDSNTYYRTPSDFGTEAALMTFDAYTGRTDRSSSLEWPVLNSTFGGPLGKSGTCSGAVGGCGFDNAINGVYGNGLTQDLMISLPAGDPAASLPADPRPSLPLDLYNGSFNQHQMVRNNWASPTLFSFSCNNSMINHEHQWCGKFEIFANGEYITKGRTVFTDYNENMAVAQASNEKFIQNSTGTGCNQPYCPPGGGQFDGATATVNPSGLLHSELPGYAADIVDDTGYYNGSWAWASPYDVPAYNDVAASSRSLIYLRGTNQVVFYDRATTGHPATKDVYQTITGTPAITGNVASWPTRSAKQKAYLTTLLPSGATLANNGLPCVGCSPRQADDWEPAAQLQIAAPGTPASAQFLTVMEWGPSSLPQTPTTLVQSTAGSNFDGALVGSSLVMFMRKWPATFSSVTYPASGATTHYVSDLAPHTAYSLSGAGVPPSATADAAGVLTFAAAGTGDITIRSNSPAAAVSKRTVSKLEVPGLCAAAAVGASIAICSRMRRTQP